MNLRFWQFLIYLIPTHKAGKLTEKENRRNSRVCGSKPVAQPNFKSYGGEAIGVGEYPWIAAIRLKDVTICSAVLISSRHVLTAAHCVLDVGPRVLMDDQCQKLSKSDMPKISGKLQDYTIQVGSRCQHPDDPQCRNTWLHPIQLFYHNGFDDCSNANDLAVFELEKDVKLSTAIPICMPKRNTTIPYLLMSIGSGISRPPEQDEDVLKIPSFGNQLMFNYFLKTSNKRIYTTLPPGKGVCMGDSGGPLFETLEPNRSVLVGITSFDDTCEYNYGYSISAFNEVWNPCERPDVFTASTDVRRYLDWICDKTGVCSTKVAEDDPDTDYCNNDKDIKSSASSFHLCIVLLYLLLGV